MDYRVLFIMGAELIFALLLLFREKIYKNPALFAITALLVTTAFILRAGFLNYETPDYQDFLSRWVEFFRLNGGFAGLKYPIGNYNIPYLYFLALFSYIDIKDLYLIKLLSFFFDVLLAWAVMKLISRFSSSPVKKAMGFTAVLYLPTVFLNSAVWGQCDSTYVSLALLGIYFALDERPLLSMVLAALSFGFKLQAVFLLPVYAVLWMGGRLKLKHFLIFPLSYILLVLPAVFAGRPFTDTLTLYFSQTGSIGSGLNYNSPSVFAFFDSIENTSLASALGIAAAFLFMLLILGISFFKRESLSDSAIMWALFLFALGIPFLLPHMHDRYFYACDILSLLLAFAVPFLSPAALLSQFASLLGYHAYLKCRYLLTMDYGAAALILLVITGFFGFFKSLGEKSFKKI